ncbi:MAG: Rrf2 family transcriptional regulator [Eubacteriaceae bacterium]|nr:Rrf2 family transcriptional regulator [Eubacteriaceae bacterium]MBQ1466366.1 Rrf2 family transcriptional regulator [Eubacteriaceae bacterium]MCR4893976.1 Rrf2 family transcriptional regulator [Eubacteriales bacterium]
MISTRGRYALRVMTDLAKNSDGGYVPLKDVAARQGISKKYLEIIVRDMVSGDLVEAASGRGGGYRLRKPPEDYTVWEILRITEGPMDTVACLAENAEQCPMKDTCPTLPMWAEYDSMIKNFFMSKKLTDLL